MDPKSAMDAVMQRMGRAAREGKARRFSKQSPVLEVGEVTLEPKAEGGMGELRGAGAKADSGVTVSIGSPATSLRSRKNCGAVSLRTNISTTPEPMPMMAIQSGTPSPRNGGEVSLAACP